MKNLILILAFACVAIVNAIPRDRRQTNPSCRDLNPCDRPLPCNDGDVVADPYDCYKYYECNLGLEWLNRECPYPFLFDNWQCICWDSPDLTCRFDCLVNVTDAPTTTLQPGVCPGVEPPCIEFAKYANQANCYSYFLCLYQDFVLQECPAGTVFDIAVADCVNPYEGFDCANRCNPAALIGMVTGREQVVIEEDEITDAPVVASCVTDPCDRPQYCAHGEITPDSTSCAHYYQCEFSAWVHLACPFGSYFNQDTCFCADNEPINCFPDNCPLTTTQEPLPEGPCPGIPDPCEDGKLYPDQGNCNYYYECVSEVLQRKLCNITFFPDTCIPGLPCVFDIHSEICLWPDGNFDCDERCTYYPTTAVDMQDLVTEAAKPLEEEAEEAEEAKLIETKVENAKAEAKHDDPGTKSCVTDPCNLPQYCAHGEITPDSTSCGHYYQCEFSAWVHLACPFGSYFNQDTCYCADNEPINCFPDNCPLTTTQEPLPEGPCPGIPDPCENGTLYPDQGNCNYYHECVSEVLQRKLCNITFFPDTCIPGLPCVFDIHSELCIWPDGNFDCNERCTYYPTTAVDERDLVTEAINEVKNEAEVAKPVKAKVAPAKPVENKVRAAKPEAKHSKPGKKAPSRKKHHKHIVTQHKGKGFNTILKN